MVRDDELIRDMLFFLEDVPAGRAVLSKNIEIADHDPAAINQHAMLLLDAELVAGKNISNCAAPVIMIYRLTMRGHDFLATVRDDTVWRRTLERLSPIGGGTLDIVEAVATDIIARGIGLR